MKLWYQCLGALGLTLALGIGSIYPTLSQETPSTSTDRGFFLSPPRLIDAETTFNGAFSSNATYFFTLELPEDAGSSLQRVQITQRESSTRARRVQYDTTATRAFVGTPNDRSTELTISETRFDRDSQTISVSFDPPIPPGTTVTLRLRPERNPRLSGVYLFGVTAYPTGTANRGQFLGYGRLHFYDNDSQPFL